MVTSLHHARLGMVAAVFAVAIAGGFAWAAEESAANDDWDWGAVTDLDDAPVTGNKRSSAALPNAAVAAVPQPVENAAPDFAATPRAAHTLFVGMPTFEVITSQRNPDMHPCSNCHQWVQSNPEPRKLKQPHDGFELEHGLHGKGKFWCFTCHDLTGKGGLKTLEGDPLEFDDAYILCSQCHSDQARDWAFGAHGKRVGDWQGNRQVYSCTACHYQHRPAVRPREPEAGPVIRVGLPKPEHWVAKQKREHPGDASHAEWELVNDQPPPNDTLEEDRVTEMEQVDGEKS